MHLGSVTQHFWVDELMKSLLKLIMKYYIILSYAIFSVIGLNASEINSDKKDLIKEAVLVASGGSIENLMAPSLEAMVANILQQMSAHIELTESDANVLSKMLLGIYEKALYTEESLNILLEKMYIIYDKYYTTQDLRDMLEFYKSDIGKKTLRVMPYVLRDSTTAGVEWSQEMLSPMEGKIYEEMTKVLGELGIE